MGLSTTQLQILRTNILADPTYSLLTNDQASAITIAAGYNTVISPEYVVWKGPMPVSEIEEGDFAWHQLNAIPTSRYRIWERMTASGVINPTLNTVRLGIYEFCKDNGGTTISLLLQSILPKLKRGATNVEKLFAVGSGTTESPSVMGFEGPLSYVDVLIARNL